MGYVTQAGLVLSEQVELNTACNVAPPGQVTGVDPQTNELLVHLGMVLSGHMGTE